MCAAWASSGAETKLQVPGLGLLRRSALQQETEVRGSVLSPKGVGVEGSYCFFSIQKELVKILVDCFRCSSLIYLILRHGQPWINLGNWPSTKMFSCFFAIDPWKQRISLRMLPVDRSQSA